MTETPEEAEAEEEGPGPVEPPSPVMVPAPLPFVFIRPSLRGHSGRPGAAAQGMPGGMSTQSRNVPGFSKVEMSPSADLPSRLELRIELLER